MNDDILSQLIEALKELIDDWSSLKPTRYQNNYSSYNEGRIDGLHDAADDLQSVIDKLESKKDL